jgi:hypothetical protein
VRFMQMMMAHHAQAVVMSAGAASRSRARSLPRTVNYLLDCCNRSLGGSHPRMGLPSPTSRRPPPIDLVSIRSTRTSACVDQAVSNSLLRGMLCEPMAIH